MQINSLSYGKWSMHLYDCQRAGKNEEISLHIEIRHVTYKEATSLDDVLKHVVNLTLVCGLNQLFTERRYYLSYIALLFTRL